MKPPDDIDPVAYIRGLHIRKMYRATIARRLASKQFGVPVPDSIAALIADSLSPAERDAVIGDLRATIPGLTYEECAACLTW